MGTVDWTLARGGSHREVSPSDLPTANLRVQSSTSLPSFKGRAAWHYRSDKTWGTAIPRAQITRPGRGNRAIARGHVAFICFSVLLRAQGWGALSSLVLPLRGSPLCLQQSAELFVAVNFLLSGVDDRLVVWYAAVQAGKQQRKCFEHWR